MAVSPQRQREVEEVFDRHRGRLWLYPGITGMGVGLKTTGGVRTDELALVVYVEKKRDDLPESERLPAQIEGVATDVVEGVFEMVPTVVSNSAEARQRQDPLTAGLEVANRGTVGEVGTLGCFIYTTGRRVPAIPLGVLMMSNQHVLRPHPNDPMTEILQPGDAGVQIPPNFVCGNYRGGYWDALVDAAVTTVEGRGWQNVVPDGQGGSRPLAGIRPAVVGERVFKFGSRTGFTTGKVVNTRWTCYPRTIDRAAPVEPVVDAIYIESEDPTQQWIGSGDSGSIVVADVDNRAVALHANGVKRAAIDDNPPTLFAAGIAFPILRVLGRFLDDGGDVRLAQAGDPLAPNPAAADGQSLMIVPAYAPWNDTGVVLTGNTTVRVDYIDGQWTSNPALGMMVDADGYADLIAPGGYALPGRSEGMLVGKVVQQERSMYPGTPPGGVFAVGTGAQVPEDLRGRLYLSINDDTYGEFGVGLADNQGVLQVRITVTNNN